MLNINKTWKELYIEMQASPLEEITDKAFAEKYQVNYNTLSNWKQDHRKEIFDEVDRRRKDFLKQVRAVAFKSLIKKLDKDTNALKLFFQLSGDLVERTENRTEIMRPEDLKRGISEMLREIESKKKAWETGDSLAHDSKAVQWEGEPGVETGTPTTPKDVQISINEQKYEPGEDIPPTGKV